MNDSHLVRSSCNWGRVENMGTAESTGIVQRRWWVKEMIIGVGTGQFYADVWYGYRSSPSLGSVHVARVLHAHPAIRHTGAGAALGEPLRLILYG